MADPDTLELRFVGSRFAGGRIPLEVLPDLSAFRDLVIALAKNRWFKENPDRQRLPRGFNHSLEFDLIDVKDGSAAPQLQWNRHLAEQNAPDLANEIGRLIIDSYGEAASLFNNAGADRFPSALPSDQIGALNRFGSSLKQGERIEFTGQEDQSGKVVFLDTVRRMRLITKVSDRYNKNYKGTGRLKTTSADGWIAIDCDLGRISINVPPAIIIEHYDGNLESEVQFELLIELDSQDQFRRVVDCIDVTIVDSSDALEYRAAMDRIGTLRDLGAGWLDGAGAPISQSAVKIARSILYQRPELVELQLGIFPTEEGGITFEFRHNGWDYNIEILHSGSLELYGVEVDGDEDLRPVVFEGFSDLAQRELDTRLGRTVSNG